MRTELPAERLHRRLGAQPDAIAQPDRDAEDCDADTDPNSLLPRWLPDGSAQQDGGWLAKVRADPGRAGAIALAAIAAIAIAQKLLPPRAAIALPVTAAIVALGILILVHPATVPGLMPAHSVAMSAGMHG